MSVAAKGLNLANKHGLSRDIPAAVKLAVRQRDGFGCVVCGNAVIEYEHFDPEFADATVHDPSGIILLCISCHARKTRGLLSRETVAKAAASPKAKEVGFSHGPFDLGSDVPEVVLGNIAIRNTPVLIRVDGDELLSVRAPEVEGGPFRLSAYLTDGRGRLQLAIVDNEWQSPTSNWDVSLVGQRITIRSGVRDIALVLRSDPPNRLIVERLKLAHRALQIQCQLNRPTRFFVGSSTELETYSAEIDGCEVGIEIVDQSIGIGRGGSVKLSMTINPSHDAAPVSNVIPLFRE